MQGVGDSQRGIEGIITEGNITEGNITEANRARPVTFENESYVVGHSH